MSSSTLNTIKNGCVGFIACEAEGCFSGRSPHGICNFSTDLPLEPTILINYRSMSIVKLFATRLEENIDGVLYVNDKVRCMFVFFPVCKYMSISVCPI